ncbi:MAG TPA: orotidine-5'-phosphate decarboxylase [Egibacteraceae bacterium]|nr:orotidine-5'-phosphate decarboxylase [Egibacteraceae bacterium]
MNPLIAALDTADLDLLGKLAATIGPHVGHLKVGLEAYTAHGPAAVAAAAAHAPVFLDLKLHDIPTTVARAAAAAAGLGIDLLTVHASGGPAMVGAAVDAAPGVRVLAVTVLTSLDDAALAAVGQPPAAEQVPRLAAMARAAGAAGIVCAPVEAAAVRRVVGAAALVVTPGIRLPGSDHHDQARVATPRQAREAGASHLVVGRALTQSDDPGGVARAVLEDLRG